MQQDVHKYRQGSPPSQLLRKRCNTRWHRQPLQLAWSRSGICSVSVTSLLPLPMRTRCNVPKRALQNGHWLVMFAHS